MKQVHVVGAAIVRDSSCLVARRGPGMSFAGKWEFPGGKIEPGEAPESALAREICEELGVEIDVGRFVGRGEAAPDGKAIVLDVYLAHIRGGELVLREHDQIAWASADELTRFDWAEPDVPVLEAVVQALKG